MQRVVLATGGTGGHIFPALAVADALTRLDPHLEILFLGGRFGPEAELAVQKGFSFIGLPVRGITGRGAKGFFAALGLAAAFFSAWKLFRQFKPDCVLGFGGYAAFAGVMAAAFLRIPCALHEQNAIPGKCNRLLGRFVRRVYLSFPLVQGFSPSKVMLTGNPVRQDLVDIFSDQSIKKRRAVQRRRCNLLVMGGSLGARALNDAVSQEFPRLSAAGVCLWHQTGKADYERLRTFYQERTDGNCQVDEFIDDISRAYVWADLILCRAGGSSLAELMVAGKPAVLVPFPFAAHNHQWHNAEYLASRNAAVLLEQQSFSGPGASPRVLTDELLRLLRSPDLLDTLAENCRELAKPEASLTLARETQRQFSPFDSQREGVRIVR